jgi:hypothetical protein
MKSTKPAGAFIVLGFYAFSTAAALSQTTIPDFDWQVENRFRFYQRGELFAIHEQAFKAKRGPEEADPPKNIIWQIERQLNDGDCTDPSTPDTCAASHGTHYNRSRLGWAAQTLDGVCYDNTATPRRYRATCKRAYAWSPQPVVEDYVLPEAHTVSIGLSPAHVAELADEKCDWTWQKRTGGDKHTETNIPCKQKIVIERVPFSLDLAKSGVSVEVVAPASGKKFSDQNISVEDLFIVALGDSFASGESNPDRPVSFSASRAMIYGDPLDPPVFPGATMALEKSMKLPSPLRPAAGINPRTLPRRLLQDEREDIEYDLNSAQFTDAFKAEAAKWLSADCHRSQYSYSFRVALELALERPHRAVTFVHLACTGAEVTAGLFNDKDAREGPGTTVTAQFDQLTTLLCKTGERIDRPYPIPFFNYGETTSRIESVVKSWCKPEDRKRPVDMVLLSIGGNDVGFSALAAYAITENTSDLAPIAWFRNASSRFGRDKADIYLALLDQRLGAVKKALAEGFGVEPASVIHTSYERIHQDENKQICGDNPRLGMDVHPKFSLNKARLTEVAAFLETFFNRLLCIADVTRGTSCPNNLATGSGTGFRFVTDHQPEFDNRGICARDPARPELDEVLQLMPRKKDDERFNPYYPSYFLPYASRQRLFRTPNDAFLTANTHSDNISPFDRLQPPYAGLFSGAVHPSAEAHAIVADHVMPYARDVAKNIHR